MNRMSILGLLDISIDYLWAKSTKINDGLVGRVCSWRHIVAPSRSSGQDNG